MHPGNIITILDFWCHQKSLENLKDLIIEYETKNNINFDIILRIRTDVHLSNSIVKYYNNVIENNVYVASEPRYDIYNRGSYPDFLIFGRNKEMKNILNAIHIIENCLYEPHTFHPESSAYAITKYYNYNCNHLPITVSKVY